MSLLNKVLGRKSASKGAKVSVKKFKTIKDAVKYLDKKYSREGWLKSYTDEDIKIAGILVLVQHGFRFDPMTDKEYSFVEKANRKHPDYNIRLS